ncbi:hypothetical protein DFJ73DRAFT_884052 [Zopfochytrium polystomum]|nr:hypothetical protein DFJ73DRAFT_884052 [Zopfochytrium polystomum]
MLRGAFQTGCGKLLEELFLATGVLEAIFKYVILSTAENPDYIIADFACLVGLLCVWDVDYLLGLSAQFDAELPGRVVARYAKVCVPLSPNPRFVCELLNARVLSNRVSFAYQRKLATLALLSLLSSMHPSILPQIATVFVVASSALFFFFFFVFSFVFPHQGPLALVPRGKLPGL